MHFLFNSIEVLSSVVTMNSEAQEPTKMEKAFKTDLKETLH